MNQFFNPNKLLLQELKDIAYTTPKPFRWAMVWFLLWFEPYYVDYKAKKAVEAGSRCNHLKGKIFPFDWNKIYIKEKK